MNRIVRKLNREIAEIFFPRRHRRRHRRKMQIAHLCDNLLPEISFLSVLEKIFETFATDCMV